MVNFTNIIKDLYNNYLYTVSLYCRQAAGTIILFVIARYLPIYDYGLFSSYKNIAFFILMFANLSFDEYILVSSKANVNKVKSKISLFLLNAFNTIVLAIVLSSFFRLENHFLFCLIVIRTFLDNIFFSLILPYFQATKKFNMIAKINLIYAFCIILIALLSYIFQLSLIKFLMLNIILGLINYFQCLFHLKLNKKIFFTSIYSVKKILDKSIFNYIVVALIYLLFTQIPLLYVSIYVSKESAALFFAAYTISTIINLLVNAQVQKLIPQLIKTPIENIKEILKSNTQSILSITCFIFLIILISGKLLLKIFYGQNYYIEAYPILLVLMFSNICIAVANTLGSYITASNNQKKKIPIQIEACIIAIIGIFSLHNLGIYATAISIFIASFYLMIRNTSTTYRLLNQNLTK